MDAMSKKEKLARGSAVIKVMRVNPRPGHYLKHYVDPRKLPKAPKPALKGVLADMPHLDVKDANLKFSPRSAKIQNMSMNGGPVCKVYSEEQSQFFLEEEDEIMKMFDYRDWVKTLYPGASS